MRECHASHEQFFDIQRSLAFRVILASSGFVTQSDGKELSFRVFKMYNRLFIRDSSSS